MTLTQMYGNGRRHSRTISFACLTLNLAPEYTLHIVLICSLHSAKHTYRFKATFTLISTLPLCKAKSIRATVSSFNVPAVVLMRSSQHASCLCISVQQH